MEKVVNYFDGDELAAQVWIDKYALKDKEGKVLEETPKDMHIRLAKEFHRIEKTYKNPLNYEQIYKLFKDFQYFILSGSPLFGIGNNYSISSLGNCFVIGNTWDSYGGILKNDEELVQLMKRRAGVGLDLSHLRHKNSFVSNAAKSSTGIISFAERYSNSTREVAQEGRRGALMLSLDINHPDIESFITAKTDLTKITGANISIKITNQFMKAVENDELFELKFKEKSIPIKAQKLWNALIHQAWKTAEPGVLFWDKIIQESPADCYTDQGFETISTNPCGEIPLCRYDSCRLGAMNIYSFVDNPFTSEAVFCWAKFDRYVQRAQRLMDDLIDLEEEKINKILEKINSDIEPPIIKHTEKALWTAIKKKLISGRRTGLGLLGQADAGAALGLIYGTNEYNDFAEEVNKKMAISSYSSSITMAKERGAFPLWKYAAESQNPFLKRIIGTKVSLIKEYSKYGRRNISNLTIAPTGSISILARTTSGIEPTFKINYKRRKKVTSQHHNISFTDDSGDTWEEYEVFHHKFKVWLQTNSTAGIMNAGNFNYPKIPFVDYWQLNLKNGKRIVNPSLEQCIEQSPYNYALATQINPIIKIEMQGRIQKWIDHAISVTHNLPRNTTEEYISTLFKSAWTSGCKGITIYREGSRSGVLIPKEDNNFNFKPHDAPKRPKNLSADIYYPTIKSEQYIVMVGLLNNRPYEVFCFKKNGLDITIKEGSLDKPKKSTYNLLDKNGTCIVENLTQNFEKPIEEFATRLISTSLRHGTDIKFIVEQLNKSDGLIQDYSKVIARTLKRYIIDGDTKGTCPKCNGPELRYEDGCLICKQCGYSKCS